MSTEKTELAASSKPSEEKPWAELETELREIQTGLRGLSRRLLKALDFDKDTKRPMHPYGRAYSHAALPGAINQVVLSIENGMPVEIAKGDEWGYRTNYQVAIKKAAQNR